MTNGAVHRHVTVGSSKVLAHLVTQTLYIAADMALKLTWATVPLLLREIVELLLNSDAHKIQQRTMSTTAAKRKESRRLLLDLPEDTLRC